MISKNIEARNRHKKYADILFQRSRKQYRLLIVNEDFLKLKHKQYFKLNLVFYFLFLIRLVKFFKNSRLDIALVICGEPWLTYWFANLAGKISMTNFPIQIQFHGDFGSKVWQDNSKLNFLKYKILRFDNPQVVSLRFVSEIQYQNLASKIAPWQSISVIPLPLSIIKIQPFKNKQRAKKKFTLILVGRVELERGLKLLMQLLSKLDNFGSGFRIVIAGSGSKLTWLKNWIELNMPKMDLEIKGFLHGAKLYKEYCKADLYLNLADSESYGRAARESLIAGTPILAIKSSGIKALQSHVNGSGITLLPSNLKDISDFPKVLAQASQKKISKIAKLKLIQESQTNFVALIDDWIKIVQKT